MFENNNSIISIVGRFYSLIENYQEGCPKTRYKSWEWCHKAFLEKRKEFQGNDSLEDEEIIDYLALHLGFYLASWGMYRGSSYLLQRDYKANRNAVKIILKTKLDKKFEILWDYIPDISNIDKTYELLFDKNDSNLGLYWKIKDSYPDYDSSNSEKDIASDTLTTKILIGTFGCIPAFDRFLKKGIVNFKKQKGVDRNKTYKIKNYKFTTLIENKKGSTDTFKALAQFYIDNKDIFTQLSKYIQDNKKSVVLYPPMKLVDMYFWQKGYNFDSNKN